LGCQSSDAPTGADDLLTGAEIDALMFGSWAIERANVTFFDPDTGEAMTPATDVFADHPVPIVFDTGGPVVPEVMLSFGGSFHFGEGATFATRWSRIYLTIIEDGEYYRNAEEEIAGNPPPFGNPLGGGNGESWMVDDSFRMVVVQAATGHIEAMVDMDDDGESVWLDYDREAQLFNDSSCINSVHLTRIASN
jgi:hypothetical protein